MSFKIAQKVSNILATFVRKFVTANYQISYNSPELVGAHNYGRTLPLLPWYIH